MEPNFNEIKQEILRRAKKANACKSEYGRACAAETISELSQVIKDNFDWACIYGVLTVDLIERYKEDFSANDIYANQNAKNGYLLCDSATVEAYGNAIVKAYGNSIVEAYDNAKVEAFDSTTVRAHDGTMIQAYNNATVKAFDDATVSAYRNSTVEAYDYTYCTSLHTIDCKLFNHAIYCVRGTNTVYYADSDLKFVKQWQKPHRTKNGVHSLLSLERVKQTYESTK